jgi:UDP-N-acetylmuramoyl-L-alanyl-D-glutamate--2,6-diaminopimelate ligase
MSALSTAMNLRDLLADVALPAALGDMVVRGLQLDSRLVMPGDAFVARQGAHQHGITFAPTALARGAQVILAEAPAPVASAPFVCADTQPVLWIEQLRDQLGGIASRFYGAPSAAMQVIGVTGTNGKTSTVQLLAQALSGSGLTTASIGTLGAGLHGALRTGERTTPDVLSVHALFAEFHDEGASHVAMEVSSHALDQGRVDAIAFDIAVFTNLTRDHLDYHGDMQSYAAAKARLFAWPGLSCAVINADDVFGRELLQQLPSSVSALSYGIDAANADIRASTIKTSAHGLRFHLHTPWGEGAVKASLLGRFNIANLLAVIGCLGTLDFSFARIQTAIAQLQPVTGRMNRLGGENAEPLIVIDYAHTPDALEQTLTNLRAHCDDRLICVFGCGGERDQGKRPQMGVIAERLADVVIVTDDNPRGENGDVIVAQILDGFSAPNNVTVERHRAAAITLAIKQARCGDVVLIAGKGHEDYQEIGGQKLPFDDLQVARSVLQARTC